MFGCYASLNDLECDMHSTTKYKENTSNRRMRKKGCNSTLVVDKVYVNVLVDCVMEST